MKTWIGLLVLWLGLVLTNVRADLWGDYINVPGSVPSGTGYSIYVGFSSDGGSVWVDLYKNGSYFAHGLDYLGYQGDVSFGFNAGDTGNQTIEYDYYGYEDAGWTSGNCSGQAWVTIYVPNHAPVGCFDGVANASKGNNISASGWAVDYEMGAPVDHVDYYIDGNYAGRASLGGYRPDVQNANVNGGNWSPNDVTWAGWLVTYNTAGLSIGDHSLRIVVYDNQGASADIGTKTFSVSAHPPNMVQVWADRVAISHSTTLRAHVTDAGNDLQWVDFYVSGPGMPGWNKVGRVGVSGGDATAQLSWLPMAKGDWAVHARAGDNAGAQDQGGVTGSFKVISLDTDSNGNGVPDIVEIALGLDPDAPNSLPSENQKSYQYDKLNRLKQAPEGNFTHDTEGNTQVSTP